MNKLIFSLLLVFVLTALILPVAVSAASLKNCCKLGSAVKLGPDAADQYAKGNCVGEVGAVIADCPAGCVGTIKEQGRWGVVCALGVLYTVLDWFFVILVLYVILKVIQAAWGVITAGTIASLTGSKDTLLAIAVGMALAIGAKMIPSIAEFFFGF